MRKGVRHYQDALINSDFDRRQRRRNALFDIAQLGDDMFARDGLVANWEFDRFETRGDRAT
jgi:hypothetical protein